MIIQLNYVIAKTMNMPWNISHDYKVKRQNPKYEWTRQSHNNKVTIHHITTNKWPSISFAHCFTDHFVWIHWPTTKLTQTCCATYLLEHQTISYWWTRNSHNNRVNIHHITKNKWPSISLAHCFTDYFVCIHRPTTKLTQTCCATYS